MFLKNIKLTNFRNFSKIELKFSEVCLIIGNNAQGKTNLLESIYFLATTKSPRVEKEFQLIKQEMDFCRVEGMVEIKGEEDTKLEIAMQFKADGDNISSENVEKRVKVNGISKRVLDYIGNLVVVYFSPEDINLVSGSPGLRRTHLDLTLSQVDKEYKKALSSYITALTSRNRVLKKINQGLASLEELEYWTEGILNYGQIISSKRKDLFDFLNQEANALNKTVGSFGEVQFIYKQSTISKLRLSEYQGKEIAACASLIGPHRDDFIFNLNGANLSFFGSRGQQRMAVLDLKLLELEFIKNTKGVTPLLLLDDIFSELDEQRRAYVISIIDPFQTILTSIEKESMPEKFLQSVQVIKLEKGKTIKA